MSDINQALLNHVISGGGPAVSALKNLVLKYSLFHPNKSKHEDFLHRLTTFLQARTDARRLITAQEVVELVLEAHDIGEMTKLRKKVAELELSRIIEYKKQRDHTSHTLYLFLLGIWLYDIVPAVRESYVSRTRTETGHSKMNERAVGERFVFQWLYASLLHDIGYIFSELKPSTTEFRRDIDGMFELTWLEFQLLSGYPEKEQKEMQKTLIDVHATFTKLYGGSKWPRKTSESNDPAEILSRISYMPWISDLGLTKGKNADVLSLFDIPQRKADDLRSFAYKVAKSGYSKNGIGAVDHAVASGLLLLQYTTYWYWIMATLKNMNPKIFKKLEGPFLYSNEALATIVGACRAVAYHNMEFKDEKKRFDLGDDPLIFLEILCDELSTWERFPASKDLTSIWNQENFLESNDISLSSIPDIVGVMAEFKINNTNFDLSPMTEALDRKLQSWSSVIWLSTDEK